MSLFTWIRNKELITLEPLICRCRPGFLDWASVFYSIADRPFSPSIQFWAQKYARKRLPFYRSPSVNMRPFIHESCLQVWTIWRVGTCREFESDVELLYMFWIYRSGIVGIANILDHFMFFVTYFVDELLLLEWLLLSSERFNRFVFVFGKIRSESISCSCSRKSDVNPFQKGIYHLILAMFNKYLCWWCSANSTLVI